MAKILGKATESGVRLSGPTRRKPRQQRAHLSSEALQEAFVRVLMDKGYAKATIREIAAVAGVGIGTFYDYVANKDALAALTIHMHVKQLAIAMAACAERHRGVPTQVLAAALIDDQVDRILSDIPRWAELFVLERQVSSRTAYSKHYEQFVSLWQQALASASDAMPVALQPLKARMIHAIVYGWMTQSLITQGPAVDGEALRDEVKAAVSAYLRGG
ncbi:TetR/AcrR family transcriptional regulator [uncultured Aquabacterium sp.]|uniref:TetR/AcrR family transcriptional regulator n=1 Tax=uncultured Aquabacterium sp. TaxID=158753 RepID=UPI002625FE08|nr:TetR/AcrR family transcriptional regulator [uncultured Aquabacterium sp.]